MIKKISVFLLTCVMSMGTMTTVACTPAQELKVVQDVQHFIPVITNVGDSVCGFSPSNVICTGAVTVISASATVLDNALVAYFTAKANGTVPPGIIADLNEAIAVFEAQANQILNAVRVLNPILQAEIGALVSAAQVLLAVIETLFPNAAVKAGSVSLANFNLNSFAGSYNRDVKSAQKYMAKGVILKQVHLHNSVFRLVPGVN
jgi:hypothetical protein